jgi:hypothetical protein
MAFRSALYLGGLIIAGVALTAGCGDSKGNDKVAPSAPPSAPPSSPSATPSATTTPSATATTNSAAAGSQRGIQGARSALQAFLRAQAEGDQTGCRYVVPGSAFEKGGALLGDCVAGMRRSVHFLRPREREALQTVVVSGGRLAKGEAIMPFSGLSWTRGNLTVASIQDPYVLRWNEKKDVWQIVR